MAENSAIEWTTHTTLAGRRLPFRAKTRHHRIDLFRHCIACKEVHVLHRFCDRGLLRAFAVVRICRTLDPSAMYALSQLKFHIDLRSLCAKRTLCKQTPFRLAETCLRQTETTGATCDSNSTITFRC